jgi:hypothetical protein
VRTALWAESYNTEIFGNTHPTDSLSFRFVRRLSLVWKSGRYETYEVPQSGENFQWHFDLPPGWSDWIDLELPERCARQWTGYSRALLKAEERLQDEEYIQCYYEDVVDRPLKVAESLLDFLREEMGGAVRRDCESLPAVNAVSEPRPDKWRKREEVIHRLKPIFEDTAEAIGYDPVV